jgi:transposase
MQRRGKVVRHVEKEELERIYREEKEGRVKERLLAILELYEGKKIKEAARVVRRSGSTIKRWLKLWNENGYKGLIPKFSGGPKPKLNEEEWNKILEEIEGKGMTLKDVTVYIKTKKGIEYSYKTVWYVLRKKKKVRYGKPYIKNEKRPENADKILKKEWMRHYPRLENQSSDSSTNLLSNSSQIK